MKATVDREKFADKLIKISKAIDDKSILPIRECLLLQFNKDTVVITGGGEGVQLESSISCSCEESFAFCVPHKIFVTTIRLLHEREVRIKLISKDKYLGIEIKSGKSIYKIACHNPDVFPRITPEQAKGEALCEGKTLGAAMGIAVNFIQQDDPRGPMLGGISFRIAGDRLQLTGTDVTKLARMHVRATNISSWADFVLPKNFCAIAADMLYGPSTIYFDGKRVTIATESVTMIGLVLDGKYPDTNKLFVNKPSSCFELNKFELDAAVRRLKLYANESEIVVIDIKELSMTVSAEDEGKNNSGVDEIEIKGGKELRIAFASEMITTCLSNMQDSNFNFYTGGINTAVFLIPISDSQELTSEFMIAPIKI